MGAALGPPNYRCVNWLEIDSRYNTLAQFQLEYQQLRETPHGLGNAMFHSFVIVIIGYMFCRMTEFAVFFLGAWLFWPETMALYTAEKLTEQQMIAQADVLYPIVLVWIGIGVAALAAVAAGWYVYYHAPFGRFGHGTFLALILFVDFLQKSMQSPHEFKWMALVKMALLPIAVLTGTRWAESRWLARHQDPDTMDRDRDDDRVD